MGFKTFEPYAKVSVINEFLGSYQITTDQTGFFPTLSGAAVEAAAGLIIWCRAVPLALGVDLDPALADRPNHYLVVALILLGIADSEVGYSLVKLIDFA